MLYVPLINVFPDQPRPYKTVPIRIVAVKGECVTTAPPSLKLETRPLPKWSFDIFAQMAIILTTQSLGVRHFNKSTRKGRFYCIDFTSVA